VNRQDVELYRLSQVKPLLSTKAVENFVDSLAGPGPPAAEPMPLP
jgi:hypothetical protein